MEDVGQPLRAPRLPEGLSAVGLVATAAAFVCLGAPGLAQAQSGAIPLPTSVEVRTPGAYVRTSPSTRGSKRGTLALKARLAPLERTFGEGCTAPWYRVTAEGWVCGDHLGVSSREPEARQLPAVAEGEIVPGSYGFAGQDGARIYRSLGDIDADDWDRELDPGSGLHLAGLLEHDGRHYQRLVEGGFAPAGEVIPARPSRFAGAEVGAADVAFVGRRPVQIRAGAGRGRVLRRLGPRSALELFETSAVGRATWARVGEGEWVRAADLVVGRAPSPPPGLGDGERWVDVDRANQLLTAYEGTRPVYRTLVSTGRTGSATPAGIFRIWAKLATADMSDEGEDPETTPYLMQGVPWVMYFNEGIAIHGAYWHDGFGRPRSHGCVNLAPRDAAWLFEWTSPRLPPGWQGVLPTRSETGTIVVVR